MRYGRWFAKLPFVRMVAVTGSLAWDNTDDSADIDYLVVTEPGRLWISRLFVRVVAHLARLSRVKLCTNYLITERVLALTDRNLCTAYELVRMSPISGFDTYRRMRATNTWTEAYLPNALDPSPMPNGEPSSSHGWLAAVLARAARLGEWVLRSGVGGVLERLEMAYRIRKIRRKELPEDRWIESAYGADGFKDHPNAYQRRAMFAFAERLGRIAVRDHVSEIPG
jgi:predicted nucleotidyltransferase